MPASLFDPSAPVLSLLLHDTDGHAHHLLDIFPHRIHPNPGFTFDDVVLAILCHAHDRYPGGWSSFSLGGKWGAKYDDTAEDYAHPVALVERGAVHAFYSKTPLAPTAHTISITADQSDVHIQGRVYPRADFSCTPNHPFSNQRLHTELDIQQSSWPTHWAICLGAIEAAIAHGASPENAARAILGQATRLIQEPTRTGLRAVKPPSGKAASTSGRNRAWEIARTLTSLWILRAAEIGRASPTVDTPAFRDLLAKAADHPGRAAGRAAFASIAHIPHLHAHMAEDTTPTSQHEKLAIKAAQKHIDLALARALDPTMLRPMAARMAKTAA